MYYFNIILPNIFYKFKFLFHFTCKVKKRYKHILQGEYFREKIITRVKVKYKNCILFNSLIYRIYNT